MNSKVLILVLLVIATGLFACRSNGDLIPVVKTTTLEVVNADINALNFYQNGTRLNNISSLAPGGASGYLPVPTGTNMYEFKIAGASNYLINNYSLTLDTPYRYSLFAAGETSDKLFLIKDIRIAVSTTMAMIRIVNASPSGSLNISVGSLSFTGLAFKSASSFNNIANGINTITIYQSGSTTPVYSGSVTLATSTFYTLFTTGVVGGTGQNKLSASLIVN
jgi:hypothetical protein